MRIITSSPCGPRIARTHVLPYFEQARPGDERPRRAIELARAWARGEITMTPAAHSRRPRQWRGQRPVRRRAEAAHAAGQAGAVAHVAAHELGAAAYAIRAARAAAADGERDAAGRRECQWQRAQLPGSDPGARPGDQRLRNDKCWYVFDC